ncbi:MAG: serine/threonine-protein kinase, partial [Chloroflexi bacterium]|nr:serine/threonine-protein kinase [Chloroflexota bacterium]
MTLEKNTILHNRYRVVEILGQGGMGSVYRAMDENLHVEVALKENLFTTDEYMRQFRLEAVILANLRHPNLPRVSDHFDLGEQGQYLVMDFIEGEDLRFRMERIGTVPEEDVVKIGAAICDALAYLHTRKPPILHRDIKPGNVKITPEGHIFLVDFGLAKVYQGSAQATSSGARAMTPGYSPPEQYGTARTDPRTDIYSLGATMYAVLCGIIPEDGLARAMDNAKLTPLRKRNANISRRLAATIEKAMAVDPSDRFQTAEEFKKALLGSRTQNIPGSYVVEPPPAESFLPNDPSAIVEEKIKKEKTPSLPSAGPAVVDEEQEFISPLKKQKERDRKRRNALVRFIFILILLFVGSIPFVAPGILPADVRAAIPFLMPTSTTTSSPTPSPIPTQTLTATATLTETTIPPTVTSRPTNTPLPSATGNVGIEYTYTATPTATLTFTPLPSSTPTSAATPVGGSGQIAYASNRSGIPQIYLADIASQTVTQITDMPEGACQPSWSPDGEKFVFISPCKGMDEIYYDAGLYIADADGDNLTPLATVPGGDFDPAWSPDGSKIAFASLRTGQMEIFILTLGGATPSVVQATKGTPSVEARQPAWSPDGSQIVYAVKRFGV